MTASRDNVDGAGRTARRRRTRGVVTPAAPAALVLLAAVAARGQEPPPADVGPVIVTGSHLPATTTGIAQAVSVFDGQQLREAAPSRLEDVLAATNGVYVDTVGRTGGFSSLYVRGGENSHLLVLVDGVRVNDPTGTRGSTYDLSAIDVSQVERVELLRGPASAVYGSDALSGILNVITRPPGSTGFGAQAYGGLGQDGYGRAGGTLAAGGRVVQGRLAVGVMQDGESGDDATLRLRTADGALRLAPAGSFEAEMFARRSERDSSAFPDDSGGPRLAVNRELSERDADDTLLGATLGWGDGTPLSVRATASQFERGEVTDNPFIDAGVRFPVPAFRGVTDFRRRSASIAATRDIGATASVVAGIERQREEGRLTSTGDFQFDGEPETLDFALARDTDSAFAEARLRPAQPLELQLGLRYDRVGDLDAELTPSLGAVWTLPGRDTTLKFSYGEGFKPPSFFALGFPIGGNPDLEPELGSNVEFSVVQEFGGAARLQVSAFEADYRNLVDFDADTFTYVNRGRIVVRGVEAGIAVSAGPALRLDAGLTLLEIDERDDMAPLRNRPERSLFANVEYDMAGRGSVRFGCTYSGDFIDRSNPTGDVRMPGATRCDAGYTFRGRRLRFTASLDNLLDEDYEQFVGFAAQGRRLRIELRGEY